MMAFDEATRPAPGGIGSRLRDLLGERGPALRAGGVAAAALACGWVLAAIGDRFGAPLMLMLPLAAALAVMVLARPTAGIAAVFLSFPLGFISLPTDELGLQAAEITVMLVIGLVAVRRLTSGRSLVTWTPVMWLPAFMVFLAFVATPGALDTAVGIKQTAQLAGGVVLALTILGALDDLADVRTALGALFVVGLGMCLFGLQNITDLRTTLGGAVGVNRAAGVFPHPNDFGAFAGILLMLSLAWMGAGRTWSSRVAGGTVGLVAAVALAVSLSRGAWIGAGLGVITLIALLPGARRALVLAVPVTLLGAILISSASLPDQPQVESVRRRITSITRPTSNPYDDRPDIYREAFRQIGEHPWVGVGPGNFPFASATAASRSRTVGAAHAHNVLLTVGAEIGLGGVALLVAFTIALGTMAIRTTRRIADRRDRALVAGIAAAMVVQIGQGIVDFNLRNPVLSILLWSLAGFLILASRVSREREAVTRTA